MRSCKSCGGPVPCLPCRAAYKQAWAESNREKVREQKKAYIGRNPEKVRASQLRYSRTEAAREKIRANKEANRDHINARYREQYAENPAPFIIRNNRRKERNAQVGGSFTLEEKCAMLEAQGGLCANPECRTDLAETGFHADHNTPVLRGGSHDAVNRQLLCPRCNHEKGTMTNEEWREKRTARRA